jgi:hypothetical protein
VCRLRFPARRAEDRSGRSPACLLFAGEAALGRNRGARISFLRALGPCGVSARCGTFGLGLSLRPLFLPEACRSMRRC